MQNDNTSVLIAARIADKPLYIMNNGSTIHPQQMIT